MWVGWLREDVGGLGFWSRLGTGRPRGRVWLEDVGGLGCVVGWGQSTRAGWLPWCWSF